MINVMHTRNKLRQFGDTVRLKGTEDDKRRILVQHCERLGIAPVLDEELT